ncbi:tRNA 2-thiouridine(34) synthase MnmA, partial [Klebsiella pneumoniae]|nr:tRNA 2-thiouridine(34) synthase MnmA [Klebsiella pneumoniae]
IDTLEEPLAVEAKIRYSGSPAQAMVTPLGNGQVQVKFATPQRAITPGQSVVFYHDDIVIGGGIIIKTVK